MKKNKERLKKKSKVWKNFKRLVRKKALKVILDKKNYTNSPICPLCNKIAELTFFTSFRLYRKTESSQFITIHSNCVFKEPRDRFKKRFFEKLDKLLDDFDYLAEV
ncbi:MAG: hypothetical protein ACFFCV_07070 [Promethearchaeota archaeon]